MTRPTQSGWLLLAVLGAVYLASITSQSGLLLLLLGILGACFLLNFQQARQTVRATEVTPPASAHLSEGEKLSEPWRLHNQGRRPAGLVELLTRDGPLLRVPQLAPGETVHLVPDLVFHRRGVHPCGEVLVASAFPFGLLRANRRLALPGEIVVYPALYPVPCPPAAGYDLMVGGKHRGTRRSTSGTHFAGVRPLQPGDPFKQIHWKSSSKGQGLMVKTYDEELSGRVAVLIDPGAAGDETLLDNALRAAGSLMFAALDEGHHVEWAVLGEPEAHLVPPFDDGHEILDALARLPLNRQALTAENLRAALGRVSHKCSVCLVLTECNADAAGFIEQLRAQNRIVCLCLPASAPPVNAPEGCALHRYAARHMAEAAQ